MIARALQVTQCLTSACVGRGRSCASFRAEGVRFCCRSDGFVRRRRKTMTSTPGSTEHRSLISEVVLLLVLCAVIPATAADRQMTSAASEAPAGDLGIPT